jgi:hypothetical protein
MTEDQSRFIRVLEEDAAQFEKMAANLLQLIPHLVTEADRQWTNAQVDYRRSLARQHRALIELVKLRNS